MLPRLRHGGDSGDAAGGSAWEEDDAREVARVRQEALDQLQPVDKAVVMLSDLEGLSDREIGTALGLSVAAVKARLHRSCLFLPGKLAVALGYSPS
jgi:DNA-directed RNA polymerase specialized sigma24 family protein